jgi:hypothetical protein
MKVIVALMNIFTGRSDGLGRPPVGAVSAETIHAIRRGNRQCTPYPMGEDANATATPRWGRATVLSRWRRPRIVKGIEMWGQAAHVTSYPAGYGFVPSAAASAAYAVAGTPSVTVKGHVSFKGNVTPN